MSIKKIWYKTNAKCWEEALPIGNGRLGAMIYGNPYNETLQLNEDSVWSGFSRDRNNPCAKDAVKEVQKLLQEGKIQEAQKMCFEKMSGLPCNERVYQSAGNIHFNFIDDTSAGISGLFPETSSPLGGRNGEYVKDYVRSLDIERAVANVSFTYKEVKYEREYFASAPEDLIVCKFSASKKGKISFYTELERGIWQDTAEALMLNNFTKNEQVYGGSFYITDSHGIPYCAEASVFCSNGKMIAEGGCLKVENADEAYVYINIITEFRSKEPKKDCIKRIDKLVEKINNTGKNNSNNLSRMYDEIISLHIEDYVQYFNRLQFSLDVVNKKEFIGDLSTDERLEKFKLQPDKDVDLITLYADYGRYLLISCSRPGTLPANLQGIWNQHLDPPWGSKYTININTEMNYWPANICNLSECEEPLFSLLERMVPNGKKTAKVMYGCRGFTAHHNTDIWGDTAPQDLWIPATYWVLGGAWLSTHIITHFEYSMDIDFLKHYYFILKEACLFFCDHLIEGSEYIPGTKVKNLVVSPSSSPENTYKLPNGQTGALCAGCEMDNRILEQLFLGTIKSAKLLGYNDDVVEFSKVLTRLMPPVILPEGTIREWNIDAEETELGHRHISHLYGLFPGNTISVDKTPTLSEAASKTLEKRLANGGGHTGWSRAWIINFYASLFNGEKALENVQALISKSTLPNMFDNHPPFQIDGNFGGLAGIIRMIVQSTLEDDTVFIRLLPALPLSWSSGHLYGVGICYGLLADIGWVDNTPINVVIRRNSGISKNKDKVINLKVFFKNKRLDAVLKDESVKVEID